VVEGLKLAHLLARQGAVAVLLKIEIELHEAIRRQQRTKSFAQSSRHLVVASLDLVKL
jgi:hypothetical protein